jgi:hypothetical protein
MRTDDAVSLLIVEALVAPSVVVVGARGTLQAGGGAFRDGELSNFANYAIFLIVNWDCRVLPGATAVATGGSGTAVVTRIAGAAV